MAFEPFGALFEVISPRSPEATRAAIRARKKRWFDGKNGARGWIVGPFICLWWSVWDRNGPMLFGWIAEDGAGTRIVGRAGSDLNGVATMVVIGALTLLAALGALMAGSSTASLSLIAAVLIGLPLVLWMASLNRREAEPLVRFLEKTVGRPSRTQPKRKAGGTVGTGLSLTLNETVMDAPLTAHGIQDALEDLGTGDFAILAGAPERYLQAACTGAGWIVEKREGDALRHFGAVGADGSKTFDFDQMLAAFLAYACETPMPQGIHWRRI